MRTEGMSSRGMALVFHQLGAPSIAIFSSRFNFFVRSSTEASKKDLDIVDIVAGGVQLRFGGSRLVGSRQVVTGNERMPGA
jgi:hypothetical protein